MFGLTTAAAIAFVRSNWKGLAAGVAGLVLVGGIYTLGHHRGVISTTEHYEAVIAKRDAEDAKALADAQAIILKQAQYSHEQDLALRDTLQKIRDTFSTITKETTQYVKDRPELADCKLDADGVRLWNSANAAARDAANAGQ